MSTSPGEATETDPSIVSEPALYSNNNKNNTHANHMGQEDNNAIELQVHPGQDEVDRASVYSYFMERDFRYWFQHPYARLIIAYLVTFLNFFIYAEDPVSHSRKPCKIPVIGHCFSFIFNKYPPNLFAGFKVFMWIVGIGCGMLFGYLVVHQLVFNRLFRLRMFHGDQGSWITMFFTTIVSLFIFANIYNVFLISGGDTMTPYHINEYLGIRFEVFSKAAATGTWCGDFFTAWMVTDIMLQERLYPNWFRVIRRWWNRDYHRIILFWIMVIVSFTIVVTTIATNEVKWDKMNRDFMPTNEVGRAFLASFILVMDLLIVVQDWDFPHFINNFDVKLPGINTAAIQLKIPRCLQQGIWLIHVDGKWFNYGIIFMVLILDMNMWKNQIFYEPFPYGQYIDSEDKIYTVVDVVSLTTHNESQLNYEWRSTTINPLTNLTYIHGDFKMNSKFTNSTLSTRGLAFMPSLAAFLMFFLFVWFFGRNPPTEDDHYAGRLKRKRRPSRWERFRTSLMGNSLLRHGNRPEPVDKSEPVSKEPEMSISQVSSTPLRTPARTPARTPVKHTPVKTGRTPWAKGRAPYATFDDSS